MYLTHCISLHDRDHRLVRSRTEHIYLEWRGRGRRKVAGLILQRASRSPSIGPHKHAEPSWEF